MLDLIIEKVKRIDFQIRHVTIVAIADDHGDADEVGVDADGVDGLRFLGLDSQHREQERSEYRGQLRTIPVDVRLDHVIDE